MAATHGGNRLERFHLGTLEEHKLAPIEVSGTVTLTPIVARHWVAVSSDTAGVQLLDAVSGELVKTIECGYRPDALAIGQHQSGPLLVADGLGAVEVWNVDSGELVAKFPETRDRIMAVATLRNAEGDTEWIATGDDHGNPIQVWSLSSGRLVADLQIDLPCGVCQLMEFECPAGSPSWLVAACHDGSIHVWDGHLQERFEVWAHQGDICQGATVLVARGLGGDLISAGRDGAIRQRDLVSWVSAPPRGDR